MSHLGLDLEHEQHDRRRHRARRGRGCLAVLLALVVLVAAAAVAAVKGWSYLSERLAGPADYSGTGHGHVVVQVRKGQTATEIGATLKRKHVVKSVQAFTDAATTDPRSSLIQVGFYRLHEQMSGKAALALLLDPKSRIESLLTIPEGFEASQIIARLVHDTDLSRRALLRAAHDGRALGLPPYAGGVVEGYLYPATYNIAPNATARSVLSQMVRRFEQEARRLHLDSAAQARGVSVHDVVTIASLVQAEARRPQDFPKVATVIYNRLHRHMKLQLDSTVHYAVDAKKGEVFTSGADRGSTSPYNTYRYAGLPPGPIDSPGELALKAALHPADGNWIYFVTVNLNTGETKFTASAAQHERNRRELANWCRAHPGRC